jgi:hypothetical protein
MDVGTLIDAIVRQTTVLIAQLATLGGERTPLAHTANQVFLDLSRELREQGVGSKVAADMFGMALRSYQTKVQRLTESQTERGRTLWEAIYNHIREHGNMRSLSRSEILTRFRHDDPIAVRGVLRDQVNSGLVARTGRGDATRYQLVSNDQHGPSSEERRDHLVWMMVHRLSPADVKALSETLSMAPDQVEASVERLEAQGRVRPVADSPDHYTSGGCILPLGSELGWEAALFDHYQAMVAAMCSKLERGYGGAQPSDLVGGSTFSYRVWPEHPYFEEATRFLGNLRANGAALRKKIAAYNNSHSAPRGGTMRVIVYGGQNTFHEDSVAAHIEETPRRQETYNDEDE